MNITTSPTITEAQVKDYLASLLARISPDGKTGMIIAMVHSTQLFPNDPPRYDVSFSGHGMSMVTCLSADELAKEVAANTPAAKALRRREELLKELAQLDATQAKEIQS